MTEDIALPINGRDELPTREEFYTNYPFFKYWNTDNNARLLTPEGVNIYIHIPFCIQICDYCFYMKEQIKSKDQVDEYVDHLCREIAMVSQRFSLGNRPVNTIYIGGGTPSVLTERQFGKMMDALHAHHKIENPEFSFEAEPGTFNKSKLGWLKQAGVNRISMGVQSFDDEVIRLSSRKHTAATAMQSIRTVQETAGFQLNIDLLSGLAGDTMDRWQTSVETALAQQTDMLTLYKMKTYANTAFFRKGVHGSELTLPNEAEEIAFMTKGIDLALAAGYGLWTTFAFSRDGNQSKYVEHTWRGEDLVAYGASSFGRMGQFNYQNLNTIQSYFEKVEKDELPIYRTYALSFKDMIVKELLLCGVRLFSYSKKEFIRKFGFDYFSVIPEMLDQLVRKGYITADTNELMLTRQGVLFGDFVAKAIASAVKEVFARDAIGFTY
jgi:oxygen-independent coproporphyrinogen III oxidase